MACGEFFTAEGFHSPGILGGEYLRLLPRGFARPASSKMKCTLGTGCISFWGETESTVGPHGRAALPPSRRARMVAQLYAARGTH